MSAVTMNDITLRTFSVAALFVLGSFATGCAFDPNAASADAEESDSIGTVQQAAIVWRGAGAGVAPGCGASREKGPDGLCYTPCPAGFRAEVTRCLETGNSMNKICSDISGICADDTTCKGADPSYTYPCRISRPQKTSDRGVGIPPSCALLKRTPGKDGLCYPLTSTSGDITLAPTPTNTAPAQTSAPTSSGGATRTPGDICIHTFDKSGHSMVWVDDVFGGKCITQAESKSPVETSQDSNTGDEICPFVGGCGWKAPENMYHSEWSSTNHVTTNGHDLLGYGE
ncbi:MAG: hypothetical protein JST00_32540 [Deltaproteobacteria bacterium]|nr:hypothetical protein [Deltaproteobacteria bacterium]